uniref:Gamma-secretase subunit APH-1 n=1 Tax=Nothoprocta perdicaria TaxID=30464 RepID=A0A8C6ZFQ6_NOTPE
MAYVAGVGFGLMSGAFSMINLLADALGPGTVGIYGDSQLYFLTSAFMTMVLIFLHTFWGILFFHGCENRRWWEIAAVVVMHLAVSASSFCNPVYVGSLVPSYVLMAVAATWAYLLSGGSAQNVRRFLLCKSCSVMGLRSCPGWSLGGWPGGAGPGLGAGGASSRG